MKISALAEAAGIALAPHNCEGPLGSMAVLHTDAVMPTFLVQENCLKGSPGTEKMLDEILTEPVLAIKSGYYELSDKPGLGIELKKDALKEPRKGGWSRPFRFHPDGTPSYI